MLGETPCAIDVLQVAAGKTHLLGGGDAEEAGQTAEGCGLGSHELQGVAAEGEVVKTWTDAWEPASWKTVPSGEVPYRIIEQDYNYPKVLYKDFQIEVTEKGAVNVEFHYGGVGYHGLNMCGVELISGGQTLGDYHHGFAGGKETLNTYSIDVNEPGTYTVRMYVENKTEEIDSKGSIVLSGGSVSVSGASDTAGAPLSRGSGSCSIRLTGGSLFATGTAGKTEAPLAAASGAVPYVLYTGTISAGDQISVRDLSGRAIIEGIAEKDASCAILGSDELKTGTAYLVSVGNYTATVTLSGVQTTVGSGR